MFSLDSFLVVSLDSVQRIFFLSLCAHSVDRLQVVRNRVTLVEDNLFQLDHLHLDLILEDLLHFHHQLFLLFAVEN